MHEPPSRLGAVTLSQSNPSCPSPAAVFAELLRREQGRLFAYIHSLVRDLNDADDLFQQTAVILWRKFAEYDSARPFFTWAAGVARFEVANFLRTRGRSKLYFSDELNLMLVEAHSALAEDQWEGSRQALSDCMARLRQRDRELLVECYADGASVSEVARRQGRASQSIHNSLRRIRRALFECVRRTLAQQGHPEVAV
jgi:RNA polymerase sigma-70 factor (ECF subfamily)